MNTLSVIITYVIRDTKCDTHDELLSVLLRAQKG